MLTHIDIEGFRSFRHVDLDLPGLTVLIGPNGSGKSNLLDVFVLMAEAAAGRLTDGIARRGGINSLLFRGGEDKICFGFDFAPEEDFVSEKFPVHYKLHLRPISDLPRVLFEQVSISPVPPQTNPIFLVHRDSPLPVARFRRFGTSQWHDFDLQTQLKQGEDKEIESPSELAIFQVKDQTYYPTPYKLLRHLENWTFYAPIRVDTNAPVRSPQLARPGLRLFSDGSKSLVKNKVYNFSILHYGMTLF
jgi:predicted ATPase